MEFWVFVLKYLVYFYIVPGDTLFQIQMVKIATVLQSKKNSEEKGGGEYEYEYEWLPECNFDSAWIAFY